MSDVPRLDSPQARSFLTFRVGTQWYAVDVSAVFEVANMVAISDVPDMPQAILGVVNIRGNVVPVIDLRVRFNMPQHDLELTTPIIFLHHDENRLFGMIVDDVDDVILLSSMNITQSSLQRRAPHIAGLVDYENRLIMLLDPIALLASTLDDQALEDVFKSSES